MGNTLRLMGAAFDVFRLALDEIWTWLGVFVVLVEGRLFIFVLLLLLAYGRR